MTAMPMGRRISAPEPRPSAGGMAAIMVAVAVIRMGRSRMGPAFSMASLAPYPFSLKALA